MALPPALRAEEGDKDTVAVGMQISWKRLSQRYRAS